MNEKEQKLFEDDGLDLIDLFHTFWSHKFMILAIMVIVAGFMFVKTVFFTSDTYTASGMLYVSNQTDTGVESKRDQYISSGDIATSRILSTTYLEILKTSYFFEQVSEAAGGDYPWQYIAAKTSIEAVNETELLRVTVTADTANDAFILAGTILLEAPEKLKNVIGGGKVELIEPPRMPEGANSKGTIRKTIIGAIIGMIIAMLIVFVKGLFDIKIRKSEDVARRYNVSILGEIAE